MQEQDTRTYHEEDGWTWERGRAPTTTPFCIWCGAPECRCRCTLGRVFCRENRQAQWRSVWLGPPDVHAYSPVWWIALDHNQVIVLERVLGTLFGLRPLVYDVARRRVGFARLH